MLLQWILTLCLISFASTAVIEEQSEAMSVMEKSPAVVPSDLHGDEQKGFDLPLRMVRSALSQHSEDFDSHASADSASADSSHSSSAWASAAHVPTTFGNPAAVPATTFSHDIPKWWKLLK